MRLTATLTANCELRLAISNDKPLNRQMADNHQLPTSIQLDYKLKNFKTDSDPKSSDEGATSDEGALDINRKSQSMQKSNKSHSEWGKVQKPKSFSNNAKHLILESGFALDRMLSKKDCRFLTLTLPTSNPLNYQHLANWSGYLINILQQQIRNYIRDNSPTEEIYSLFVWEFQRRGALHLHYLIGSLDKRAVRSLSLRLYDAWFKCLGHIEEKSGADLFGKWRNSPKAWAKGNRIEIPRKSIARYICKYASKQKSKDPEYGTNYSKIYYPSRFWGSSRNLKTLASSWRFKSSLPDLSQGISDYLLGLFSDYFSKATHTRSYSFSDGLNFCDGFIFYFDEADFLSSIHYELSKIILSLRFEASAINQYRNNQLDKSSISASMQSCIAYMKNPTAYFPLHGDTTEQDKIRSILSTLFPKKYPQL
jgi:hypothetical protein